MCNACDFDKQKKSCNRDSDCNLYTPKCDNRFTGFGKEDGVLAALYIPIQQFDCLFDIESALKCGTMFKALDKPFHPCKEGK